MTVQNTFTNKPSVSGKGQTEAQAATSVFTRFGDWLSGASTDRSGLTESHHQDDEGGLPVRHHHQ